MPEPEKSWELRNLPGNLINLFFMLTDPISDLLTRIRNAYRAHKDSFSVPSSKLKVSILEVLQKRGFIADFETVKSGNKENLVVNLLENKKHITLKKVSKPGQRIYVKSTSLKKINGGLGVAIISTSKGVMSGEEAKKLKLGGELICEVY